MITQIKRIYLLLWIFTIPGQSVFTQHSSRNNFTGTWETPASWDPTWPVPRTNIDPYDITINGYITVYGSLSFTGTSDLIINDTLVIQGNLFLDNNSDLTIDDEGILIVRGNLTMHYHAEIIADGYLIITGDIDKHGPNYDGSLTSNDDPVKVFVGGTISPGDLTDNESDYPVLDCTSPPTTPYANSTCSYGDMTDIINDPIYSFFQSTCTKTNVNSNSPVCTGNTIELTSSGGTGYNWSGPNGFASTIQNPSIPNTNTTMSGDYIVTVTAVTGCSVTDTINVIVNALPLVSITSSSNTKCLNDTITLTGSPIGGTFIITDGPGTINGNVLSAAGTGKINLVYNYTDVCANKASQAISVNAEPVANSGPDQELKFIFETYMNAELSAPVTGEWSLISGSGHMSDFQSPTTRVTELTTGENKFLWTVRHGNCEASAEVKITVHDLFIPSVITPNGDGKNDYYKISEMRSRVELIIFNRWGNEEYSNSNYLNDWDGRNDNGKELPNDTYFYVLKFDNGKVKKGSVLIKR